MTVLQNNLNKKPKPTSKKKNASLSKKQIRKFMEDFWEKHGKVMSKLARE